MATTTTATTYTGSQLWVLFTFQACETCAVTYGLCSSFGRVIAFSCLPHHNTLWSWCLIRQLLPYWSRVLTSIGRNNLGVLSPLHWGEPHAALTDFWLASVRLRQIKNESGHG